MTLTGSTDAPTAIFTDDRWDEGDEEAQDEDERDGGAPRDA